LIRIEPLGLWKLLTRGLFPLKEVARLERIVGRQRSEDNHCHRSAPWLVGYGGRIVLMCRRPGAMGASEMHQSNVALGIALLTAFAAIIGFVAGYGLRAYISYRRHQKFGLYRRSSRLSDAHR